MSNKKHILERYDENLNDRAEQIISDLKTSIGILAILCIALIIGLSVALSKKSDVPAERQEMTIGDIESYEDFAELTHNDSLTMMAVAFAIQETKCQNISSPDGKYVGYLQMSEILVRETNNILGKKLYSYDDRRDWNCCLAMFATIMDSKNPQLDIDAAIDIWNKNCPHLYRKQVKIYYGFMLEIAAIIAGIE